MKRCLTAIVLGLAATSALAADDKTAWDVGLAATFGQYTFDSNQLDDSSAGFKLFTGYRFNKWFGLEGAYYNFGAFEEDLDPPNPGGNARSEIDGLGGSALIYAPLASDDFEVYAKFGYYAFDQQLLIDNEGINSNSPSGLVLGVGSRFRISEQFAIRAEGEWFDIDEGDLWALNLGFEYQFGRPGNTAVPAAPAAAAAPPPPPPSAPPPADMGDAAPE